MELKFPRNDEDFILVRVFIGRLTDNSIADRTIRISRELFDRKLLTFALANTAVRLGDEIFDKESEGSKRVSGLPNAGEVSGQ